jgi:hypothetical protein
MVLGIRQLGKFLLPNLAEEITLSMMATRNKGVRVVSSYLQTTCNDPGFSNTNVISPE